MALHFSKDNQEQRKLLQIAAEQGEPIAAFDLGNIYLNVSDYRNAKKWYQTCLRLIQTAKETDTSLYQEVKKTGFFAKQNRAYYLTVSPIANNLLFENSIFSP